MNNKSTGVPEAVNGLQWTGERYLPNVEGQVELEHVHRYAIAREVVRGKTVLDIASGEGYGSNFLAEVAAQVIGVDISEAAVAHAQEKYHRQNLEFRVGSCAEIPLESASVDVVVSFETIEHHVQHEEMMREIRRVLRPDGVLIMSSPDKHEFTEVHNYSTHFHVKELYRDEFETLLEKYFPHVRLYGQRVGYGSYLASLELQAASQGSINYVGNLQACSKYAGVSRPIYFVAIASGKALPILDDSFFESSLDAMQQKDRCIEEQAVYFQKIIQEKDKQLAVVYGSFSWRAAAPLRWMGRRFARLIRIFFYLIHSVKWVIYLVTGNVKYRLKGAEMKQAAVVLPSQAASTPKRKILLVSHSCPSRSHAGGLRILDLYAQIRKDFPHIKIDLYTHKRASIDGSYADLEAIFDKLYFSPTEDLTLSGLVVLQGQSCSRYDVVDLQFHGAALDQEGFRQIGGKILFTPMESITRTLSLSLKGLFVKGNEFTLARIVRELAMGIAEVIFCWRADLVVCVSNADAAFLRSIIKPSKVEALETGISPLEFADAMTAESIKVASGEKKNSIVLVAYFGSETNIIATKWFLENVHPLILEQVQNYVFSVVGRGSLAPFQHYKDSSVEFVGEVPSIAPYIEKAKIGIAPALGGSGLRGKVNQYAIFGVPCVASPIAANGLAYRDGYDIFVAAEPKVFAQYCIDLLKNSDLNDTMGCRARETCFAEYTWESKRESISRIYDLTGDA
ncbi:MAG: methyltransferase domain-containing protein [Gallionella sp.]